MFMKRVLQNNSIFVGEILECVCVAVYNLSSGEHTQKL